MFLVSTVIISHHQSFSSPHTNVAFQKSKGGGGRGLPHSLASLFERRCPASAIVVIMHTAQAAVILLATAPAATQLYTATRQAGWRSMQACIAVLSAHTHVATHSLQQSGMDQRERDTHRPQMAGSHTRTCTHTHTRLKLQAQTASSALQVNTPHRVAASSSSASSSTSSHCIHQGRTGRRICCCCWCHCCCVRTRLQGLLAVFQGSWNVGNVCRRQHTGSP